MVKAPQPARVPGPPIHTESQERERDLGAPSPLAKVETPVPEQTAPIGCRAQWPKLPGSHGLCSISSQFMKVTL